MVNCCRLLPLVNCRRSRPRHPHARSVRDDVVASRTL